MNIYKTKRWVPKGLEGIKLATKDTIASMTPFLQSRLVFPHYEVMGSGLYEEIESPLIEYSKLPRVANGLTNEEYAAWILNSAGYADAGTLPNINIYPLQRYLKLNTYYPVISPDFLFTGHSELITPYGTITKRGNELGYNLITNNCSDATLKALKYIYETPYNTNFFTTPGDVLDMVSDLGGFENVNKRLTSTGELTDNPPKTHRKYKNKRGVITQFIPITSNQLKRVHRAYLQNKIDNANL